MMQRQRSKSHSEHTLATLSNPPAARAAAAAAAMGAEDAGVTEQWLQQRRTTIVEGTSSTLYIAHGRE